MPNRKTFDPRDKYDHSSRSVSRPEKNDLHVDIDDSQGGNRDPRRKTKTTDRDRLATTPEEHSWQPQQPRPPH
jgi:hypothetical protein